MITTEAAKYLWDARSAAERIARFVGDRGYDDYLADDLVQAAVERQFEIIGEAFAGLRRVAPAIADTIPNLFPDHRLPQYPDPRLCDGRCEAGELLKRAP